jgi:uncharacterized protein (DUF4415 family)
VKKHIDLHGQEGEREEAERMPYTATAEAAKAHRNRATKSSVTHSRQGKRAVRVRVEASEREGAQPTGPGWSDLINPLGLT